jgi:hypothetical protein
VGSNPTRRTFTMRSNDEYTRVMALVERGLNDSEVARATGIPRRTVRDWRVGHATHRRSSSTSSCPACGHPSPDFRALPRPTYSYLLGLYLGDGLVSQHRRTWALRVFLDMTWPGIMLECANAMQKVFPQNRVSLCQPDPNSWCAVVTIYSSHIPCLFPQHGPGLKHLRPIELDDWQREIVAEHPNQLLRGLIHSDGCRVVNRVRVKGKAYEYPRYQFTNASEDIRALFTAACDQLGIEWRRMNERNISVARRDSVARLDEFVGPKN